MQSIQPRVVVLIPAHNAEATLGAALASLAANKEAHDIVIVDDASRKPVTESVSLPSNAVVLRLDRNRGVTAATNHGLRYILGRKYEYVARLDADDTASPTRLALQVEFMDRNPDVALSGGAGEVVSETGETLFYLNHPTDSTTIKKDLFYNSCFLQPTFIIRTTALQAYGLYDERYPNAEDYELVRRLSQQTKLANLPEYLIRYTVSSGGLSVSKRQQQLLMRLRVQLQYRDFSTIHFYLGLMKTAMLWMMPMVLIMGIKRRLTSYNAKSV